MSSLGQRFSTLDADYDALANESCAALCRGAWWYRACSQANLNGEYANFAMAQGVNWNPWLGWYYSLRRSEMKVRPTDLLRRP